jgi:transposase InsO family protein
VVPPARSTIGRVLLRNGLAGETQEPPPEPLIRFERERPNELWQIDAKLTWLADGTEVWVIACIDDHSRLCLHLQARLELTNQAAIKVFDQAAAVYGLPEATLTDRGSHFSGIAFDTVFAFERHLWAQRIVTINGRSYHPQTQGKVERFFRTVNEWLQDHGPYHTLSDLNQSLSVFADHYNHDRPHQGIKDLTPHQRWEASPKAAPDPTLADIRCRYETTRPTNNTGNISYAGWLIGLGRRWAHQKVAIIDLGHLIQIWSSQGEHIRDATPQPDRRYLRQNQ